MNASTSCTASETVIPRRLISVFTLCAGGILRTTCTGEADAPPRGFACFLREPPLIRKRSFPLTLMRILPTNTSTSCFFALTESTSPPDCILPTNTLSPAFSAAKSTGSFVGFSSSSNSAPKAMSESLFLRVRARMRSACVGSLTAASFSISESNSSARSVRSPMIRRLSTLAVANSFSRSRFKLSRSALTAASFADHSALSDSACFFASSASMRLCSAVRMIFSNLRPPSERKETASFKIVSGKPNRREMAMALLLPGTPMLTRYSGCKVFISNSMLAFSMPFSA